MFDSILRRFDSLPVLPETRAALQLLLEQDWNTDKVARDRGRYQILFGAIYSNLGGQSRDYELFLAAWIILRAALLRLDHLQDNDYLEPIKGLEYLLTPELYNLIFTYYVLATSLLDDLNATSVPSRRIQYLTRQWNDSMLWAASGQQRDLAKLPSTLQQDLLFTHYQETIYAKAGAIYSLGLGGAAALATDDLAIVKKLADIGQIYGTLLQFSDDILDVSTQHPGSLTLPGVYKAAAILSGIGGEDRLSSFWSLVYQTYFTEVSRILTELPADINNVVISLFDDAFSH